MNCPTCGAPVQVVGSDEGTQHYEPLRPIGLDRKKWTQLLEEEYASRAGGLDVEALATALKVVRREDNRREGRRVGYSDNYFGPESERLAVAYAEAVKGAGKP